jgi:hypothetical protein
MISRIAGTILISAFISCNNSNQPATSTDTSAADTTTAMESIAPEESFRMLPDSIITVLNEKILTGKMSTDEQLMNTYAPRDMEAEGNYSYTVTGKDLGNDQRELTLVESGLMDDSILGRKVIMYLAQANGAWKIISLKENYQCRNGRGHENWSADPCQ